MPTLIQLSDCQRYLTVYQSGPLSVAEIKQARLDSAGFYNNCDRALVDYREADLSPLNLLELDNLAMEFKQDLPSCRRMAIVRTIGSDDNYYEHLTNVCTIGGVDTRVFESPSQALDWLLRD
ncbi:hypothetical protein DV711_11940 [Motiliproteus coralliicola]|uniref:STAS/SEC14 domain-containing protein n=1 Tax=Motiliproteus coralliicola TaxID=2283196 RepID=A0A369WC41_9GAMM|nr:hypothetical protein [Motiliproteus coralliicola]RDE19590.1 hypothetical protein DV711_11940 [Motiliproteus coralliicola]